MAERVIKLEKVLVKKIAKITDKEDKHMLRFTLFYPRPGSAKIETLKVLPKQLESNKTKTFDLSDFLGTVVFKEKLEGEFVLRAEVVIIDELSKVGSILKTLFGGVLQFAIGKKIEGISNIYLGKAAEITNDSLFDSDGGKDLHVVGKGEVTLNSGTLPTELSIKLTSPKKFADREVRRQPGSQRRRRTTTTYLKKNEQNGQLTLRLDPI